MSRRVIGLSALALAVAASAIVLTAAPAAAVPESQPVIAAVMPNPIPTSGHTELEIVGSGFTGSIIVQFFDGSHNELAELTPTVISTGELRLITPAMPEGTVDVLVRAQGVISNLFPISVVAFPVISSLSPSSGPSDARTILDIQGGGFTGATAVHIGTASASFVVNSDSSIAAVAPGGTGSVDVTVTTPYGTSSAASFSYLDDATAPATPPSSATPLPTATSTAVPALANTGDGHVLPSWSALAAMLVVGGGVALCAIARRGRPARGR